MTDITLDLLGAGGRAALAAANRAEAARDAAIAARDEAVAVQVFVKSDAAENFLAGPAAGAIITAGEDNVLLGYQAGNQITTGSRNTIAGHSAGFSITSATDNVLAGSLAGFNLTNGSANVFLGSDAGYFATTATQNVGVGTQALRSLTTGYNNAAEGSQAHFSLTTGYNNCAFGASASYYTTTGFNNASFGFQALQENRTGKENAAFGNQALIHNLGDFNSGFGERALDGNRAGAYNTGVGGETGYIQAAGSFNTFVGGRAGRGAETIITATAVSGNGSVVTFTFAARPAPIIAGTTFQVVGLGPYDGWYVSTGGSTTTLTAAGTTTAAHTPTGADHLNVKFDVSENTIVGWEALKTPLTGADGNTCIGTRSGDAITTGKRNLVIGRDADPDNPAGNDQINVGDRFFHDRIRLLERSSDPAKPAEGNTVVWMTDGTGLGDDGDVLIASTAGGVTRWTTLLDHSAATMWA